MNYSYVLYYVLLLWKCVSVELLDSIFYTKILEIFKAYESVLGISLGKLSPNNFSSMSIAHLKTFHVFIDIACLQLFQLTLPLKISERSNYPKATFLCVEEMYHYIQKE